MKKAISLILVICLLVSMPMPANAKELSDGGWTLQIGQINVKDELFTEQIRTIYGGETYVETYFDKPTEGNCFAVVVISLQKQDAEAGSLDIGKLKLVVDDEEYNPVDSSDFLKNHNYTVFESDTILVSSSGAVCFELPASYSQSTGDGWYITCGVLRSAAYVSEEAVEVPYRTNDVDAQEDIEAAVLRDYNAAGPLALADAMIVQDVYGNAPLTAVALFDTDTACTVTVTVHGKNAKANITYPVSDAVTHHEVPIFGLYAGTENRVTITAGSQSHEFYITTDPIPDSVTTKIKANENNDIVKIADGQLYMLQEMYYTIFDVNGDVRWYLGEKFTSVASLDYSGSFVIDKDNGGFWFSYNPSSGWVYTPNTEFVHLSWMGKVSQRFSYQGRWCSHDATILPDGTILYFSNFFILKKIDPLTGESEDYIDFSTVLDSSVGGLNAENPEAADWPHFNTVEYVKENNSLLLCARDQHMIFDMDYDTKEIIWAMTPAYSIDGGKVSARQSIIDDVIILPNAEDDNFEWFYGQHDPTFVSYNAESGIFEFVMHDNGSYRYLLGESSNDLKYSRIVHYAVNLRDRTATQIFQYGKEEGARLHSLGYGSAELINRSGNYLGNFRGHYSVDHYDSIRDEQNSNLLTSGHNI